MRPSRVVRAAGCRWARGYVGRLGTVADDARSMPPTAEAVERSQFCGLQLFTFSDEGTA
ncbi:MAG TPA: hypothetical protein VII16_15305 [Actinomycetes bacterium]|jgi:hypothetical protein